MTRDAIDTGYDPFATQINRISRNSAGLPDVSGAGRFWQCDYRTSIDCSIYAIGRLIADDVLARPISGPQGMRRQLAASEGAWDCKRMAELWL